MAVLQLPPSQSLKVQPTKRRRRTHHHPTQNPKPKPKPQQQEQQQTSSSWDQIKNLLKCKQMDVTVNVTGSDPKIQPDPVKNSNGYSKLGSTCGSICSFRDHVANGNTTRVVHRPDNSPESGQDSGGIRRKKEVGSGMGSPLGRVLSGSGKSNGHGSYTSTGYRGMQFRKLSGCYECHAIVDPSRIAIPRSTICLCRECGEVFPKIESLEHHQAVRHAVLELGPEDSGRNIVEIIFKSSWQNKDHPIITIERILKVNNTRRTLQRFEDCRNTVKLRATATTSRCAADGNELLRFHCTTLGCSLGSHGSSSLCSSATSCGVCTIIRHGFQSPKSGDGGKKGVCTTASSGRAHNSLAFGAARGVRAMLVCRVIAGNMKRVVVDAPNELGGPYDSVAGFTGSHPTVEELYVYNPKAILPCFVVIYKALES